MFPTKVIGLLNLFYLSSEQLKAHFTTFRRNQAFFKFRNNL